MKLLTKEIIKKFPKLLETDGVGKKDVKVIAKFFTPWSNWTWYATEYDGDETFFGYVKGCENEFGYFSLSELESVKGPFGLKVERDLYFSGTLQEVIDGKI